MTSKIRWTTLGVAVLAAGVLAGPSAQAAPITIDVFTSADGGAQDLGANGGANNVNTINWAGDFESGSGTVNNLLRTVLIFELPSLAPGQAVQSATLTVGLRDVNGAPDPMDVYHLPDWNPTTFTDQSDIDPGTTMYTSNIVLVEDDFITNAATTSNAGVLNSTDVLTAVLNDYADDPSGARVATFRLQTPATTEDGDNASDRYGFAWGELNPDNFNVPVLTLTLVPEPGSLALLGLGGFMLLSRRRRR